MVTFNIKLNPGFGSLFMQRSGLLCADSIWLYTTVCSHSRRHVDRTTLLWRSQRARGWVGVCVCVLGGRLLSSFRSARFISWCCSWLTLTLPLLWFWPQMSPCSQDTLNFSCRHRIHRPLTQRMAYFVVVQHNLTCNLNKIPLLNTNKAKNFTVSLLTVWSASVFIWSLF